MSEYELLTASICDPSLKLALVLKRAPAEINGHLRVHAHLFEQDYTRFKATFGVSPSAATATIQKGEIHGFFEGSPVDVQGGTMCGCT